jgi:integrase
MPCIILKRGVRRWRGSVTVNGQPKQKLFPDDSSKSRNRAAAWEEGARKQMLGEQFEASGAYVSIGTFTDFHLDDVRTHCESKTFDEKKNALADFFDFSGLGPEDMVDKMVPYARPFLIERAEEYSGGSANKARKNLSRAWNFGVKTFEEKWPNSRNPFLSVDPFPEDQKKRYTPPSGDFWKVVNMATRQDRLLLLSYYFTAARRSELFRLNWSDIDYENLRVRLGTRKKGGGMRHDWMPIPLSLCEGLKSWRAEQVRILGHQQGYVFVCVDKTPLSELQYGKPYTVRQHYMQTVCELAEVKPFGYHGIRHLVAQTFYRKGKSLGFIQRYLRHQHATTTERYLCSLDCKEIGKGVDDLMLPSLDQLKADQGNLPGTAFEQVLKTGKDEADVIILDDARKTRERV